MSDIVILGSLNMDMVITTDRLPKIGETIMGKEIDYLLGGKGANQAVAASRVGGDVTLLGKIGDDTFGEKILKHLKKEPLDLSYLAVEKNMFTGIASIFKLPKDNCITVIPGANELVDKEYVSQVRDVIKKAQTLLVQLEVPAEAVKYACQIAKDNGVLTILNPAPFTPEVHELLEWVDVITPNETEFAALYGVDLENDGALEKAMLAWQEKHGTQLIVTRGEQGVSYVGGEELVTIPAIQTDIVDTTGAGDTFNGLLAREISRGKTLSEAITHAGIGASLSVQKFGAQTGMPNQFEFEQAIGEI